ncbi:hypothetical protein TcWFU_008420 [Taenia crassiceps]|uniref:Uncharacterized protein n=1 Tax=Taenia crassiceps TaxID=6207 RepID=A0ABR4QG58_9CEST
MPHLGNCWVDGKGRCLSDATLPFDLTSLCTASHFRQAQWALLLMRTAVIFPEHCVEVALLVELELSAKHYLVPFGGGMPRLCVPHEPADRGGLDCSTCTGAAEGAEMSLHCEYLVRPQPHCAFTQLISFVEEASLAKAQAEVAASTQFLFTEDPRVGERHEKGGKVMSVGFTVVRCTHHHCCVLIHQF